MKDIKFEVIRKIAETQFKYRDLKSVSRVDSVSPPSVFIGSRLKYPLVNVGILSPLESDENAWVYDAEKYWAKNDFGIADVLKLRDNLLNSRFQTTVRGLVAGKCPPVQSESLKQMKQGSTTNRFLNIAKEIAVASKPVDIEIELKKKVNVGRRRDKVVLGQGMKAPIKKAKIISNVKIHRKIDKVMNDEIKAIEGIEYLYKNNFDEYVLNKILSVGVLGLKKNKRLVPTRWSITATDDAIGKQILKRVRDYKWLEDYELFFGEFMGNHYIVLFFPNVWNYELFELYKPGSSWNPSGELKASTDFESYSGRKKYAFATAGGYYATRLPILEYLDKIKRQASVLVIRIESPGYWAALGVWVVRESVRKALGRGRMKFDSQEELINAGRDVSKVKYNYDNSEILKRSRLLEIIKTQRNLREWF